LHARGNAVEYLRAGGSGQLGEFLRAPRRIATAARVRQHQQRAFAFAIAFEERVQNVRLGISGTFGAGSGRRFLGCRFAMRVAIGHLDVAAGHHGRDRMLVNHLADLVAQQYHELVERFDRALQFDPVDQINRDRYMLAAQSVQKRILQGLALGHDLAPRNFIRPLVVGLLRTGARFHADRPSSISFCRSSAYVAGARPRNNPTALAATSPEPAPSGSNTRASTSPRSQVSWRLASWLVAKIARARNSCASVAPCRCCHAWR